MVAGCRCLVASIVTVLSVQMHRDAVPVQVIETRENV
jgi:hypothetical protein